MINKQYYEHKMRNAIHFMQHKKLIDKLENTLLKKPASIGALTEVEPSQLFEHGFNCTEVSYLREALGKYNLDLNKIVGPSTFFDPAKLDEPQEPVKTDPDMEYTV